MPTYVLVSLARRAFVSFAACVLALGSVLATTPAARAQAGMCFAPLWQRTTFVPRSGHAMCYDSVRNRLVLFGGRILHDGPSFPGDELGDTWEFDGSVWHKMADFKGQAGFPADATTGPAPRADHAMAYDPVRQRTVMWAGSSFDADRVWEWDGTSWTPVFPAAGTQQPSGRTGHAMTFDAVQKKVVMLGSDAGANDHWTWNGSAWQFRSFLPNVCCFDTHGIGVVSDPNRARLVITGGQLGPNTYEWDGTRWHLRANNSPGGSVSMTYMPNERKVRMRSSATGNALWDWNGAAWTRSDVQADTFEPVPCNRPVNSTFAGGFVVVDGPGLRQCDTSFEFLVGNPAGPGLVALFQALPSNGGPGPRFDHLFSQVNNGGDFIIQGGLEALPDGTLQYSTDQWYLHDGYWTRTNDVQPTYDSAVCYDSLRGYAVSEGGTLVDGSVVGYTYGLPFAGFFGFGPARTGHAMVFDSARDRVILFGGWNPDQGYVNDTWEFNPCCGWFQTHAGGESAPPGREQFAMAYDPIRQRTVLFGGFNVDGTQGDTWEWDGGTWHQITPAFGDAFVFGQPSPRAYHAMTFDTVRNRVVLYGGEDGSFFSPFVTLSDQWEWDGTSWFQRSAGAFFGGVNPGPRSSHGLSFDSARSKLMLSAGISPDPVFPGSGSFVINSDVLESASVPIVPPTDLGPQSVTVDEFGFVTLSAYELPAGFQARWIKDGVPLDDVGAYQCARCFRLNLSGVTGEQSGVYRLASADSCGSYLSSPITVTVNTFTTPFFTLQPMNTAAIAGETAVFTADASGVPAPSFQWVFNGVPIFDNGHYSGTGTGTLTISGVTPLDEGTYHVVAVNVAGVTPSDLAGLMVLTAPVITSQTAPLQQTRRPGETAVFTADATGSPSPSLQWTRNGQPLFDDGRIVGAFTNTLTINNVNAADFGVYQLGASNVAGSALSDAGVLIISSRLCVLDYNEDGSLNPDDIGDYISDYFTQPAIAGPGGYSTMCPENAVPYCQGYKAAYTSDGSGQCGEPNPDNLGDWISDYFLGCAG